VTLQLERVAQGELAARLEGYSGGLSDEYDWSLNAPVR
jgi:hypothetical protein